MTYQGQEVVSKLQHETLKSIAEITGGAYVPVGTANVKLGTLYRDHLSKLTARDIEESIQRRYIDRYQWFLLPAVLAFLVVAQLSKGQLVKTNKTLRDAAADTASAAVRLMPLIFPLAVAIVGAQAQTTQQNTLASAGAANAAGAAIAAGAIQAQAPGITNIQTLATSLTNRPPIKDETVIGGTAASAAPAAPAVVTRKYAAGKIVRHGPGCLYRHHPVRTRGPRCGFPSAR